MMDMKKDCPENIYGQEHGMGMISPEKISSLDHFWDDPEKIMRLVDLLFLFDDPDKKQICS